MSTVVQFPRNAGIGVGILAAGALIYPLWRSRAQGASGPQNSPDVM
jgi:hypothetical protein